MQCNTLETCCKDMSELEGKQVHSKQDPDYDKKCKKKKLGNEDCRDCSK